MNLFGKNKVLSNPPEYHLHDMVDDAINVILSSSYLSRNLAYQEKLERVGFKYTGEPIANSFAINTGHNSYQVYSFAGLTMLLCTCAAVFSMYTRTHNVGRTKRALKWLFDNVFTCVTAYGLEWDGINSAKIDEFYSRFPEYLVKENYPRYMELARKMIAFVLGHEIGHVMLGQLDSSNSDSNNVSRNNERSCDLFACSILQGTGLGGAFAEGAVFLTLTFYFMYDKKHRNMQYDTHPGMTDRVMNIVQSFSNELMYANIRKCDIVRLMR